MPGAYENIPRPSTPPGLPPPESHHAPSKLSFGVVCSSNINRSMEAHVVLGNAGLRVESYGTGTQVRLPGRTAMGKSLAQAISYSSLLIRLERSDSHLFQRSLIIAGLSSDLFTHTHCIHGIGTYWNETEEPRIYKFGVPYEEMYNSMTKTREDEEFFTRNTVLHLCRRGAAVKRAPQRWQDMPSDLISEHDVVIAFEERIYDAVVEDLQIREPTENFAPIHVICLDTKDNPEEAQLQGQVALDLCWRLEASEDLVTEAPEILDEFEREKMTHTPIKVLYQLCYL